MCGIAGFWDRGRSAKDLENMVTCLSRRGPDDSGVYFEDGVALGHRRLSIIDLSPAGHQPMVFEHLVTAFNGEIYNFKEVREDLKKEGYQFNTSSDTEVVLKAFDRWGPECVNRFIGMFAISLFDKKEKALYLIRDRAGVKPLYYYFKDNRLAFASELKSFKSYLTPEERKNIDPRALSEFLSVGYVSSGLSIIRDVKKVPQGHYLKLQEGKISITKYWSVRFQENAAWMNRQDDDVLDELEDLVVSSFKYRMVADVPVGVFLSAGVDSSLVTAVLTKNYGRLKTFTIGFNEEAFDESGDAKKIADFLGTDHTEGVLKQEKAYSILEHFYDIYDEPHGDNSCIPTAYVSELAKNNGVKVVLSADAGDELFGGYTRYIQYIDRWRQLEKMGSLGRVTGKSALRAIATVNPGAYAEKMNRFGDILAKGDFISFYQTIIRSSSITALKKVLPSYREPLTLNGNHTHILNQMCQWDFERYMADDILVKVDRATMYHSIEGREPFLDHRLVEFAAQLPVHFKIRNGETKYILKKLLGRYLPDELYRLPKRGFAAPLQSWIKDFYQEKFLEVLGDDNLALLDTKQVRKLLSDYKEGRQVNYSLLWFLFSFQLWYKKWSS